MFTRVLIPTDGTPHEQHVLKAARVLAEREKAQLMLLHVDPNATGDCISTRAALLALSGELRDDGVDARTTFAFGRPDEAIAEAASRQHVDVILISPRRRSLMAALLDPGVTTKLLRRTPAPLLVWPERLDAAAMNTLLGGESAAPVIVPLDGSAEAERALPVAEAFARQHNRVLLLVHVAVPTPLIGLEVPYPVSADDVEARAEEGRHYVERTRRCVASRSGLVVQTMVLTGGAASEVARLGEAHPGALIVMTTHGRGRVARLLMGSVAAELIGIASTPVLVVPPARPIPALQHAAQTEDVTESANTFDPLPTF
jgi:nucleotide-binding universal stress UspA family protein